MRMVPDHAAFYITATHALQGAAMSVVEMNDAVAAARMAFRCNVLFPILGYGFVTGKARQSSQDGALPGQYRLRSASPAGTTLPNSQNRTTSTGVRSPR